MKKSIYMLNLLLMFFLHWLVLFEKQNIMYRVSCSIDMNVIAVGFFFPFVKSSFSNRNKE